MQFTVPQFIDVEDKIIGPITVRQFIICVIALMVLFLEYKLSDFTLFVVLAIITVIIFGSIAFLRINSMPFHYFFINFIETIKQPSIRVWNKLTDYSFNLEKPIIIDSESSVIFKKPLVASHLADLSLIIDTGGQYRGQDVEKEDSFFKEKNK